MNLSFLWSIIWDFLNIDLSFIILEVQKMYTEKFEEGNDSIQLRKTTFPNEILINLNNNYKDIQKLIKHFFNCF